MYGAIYHASHTYSEFSLLKKSTFLFKNNADFFSFNEGKERWGTRIRNIFKSGACILKVAKTLMEKFSVFSSRVPSLALFINQ